MYHVTLLGILGDTVLARISGAADDNWYEGHVHNIHEAEVGLRFHDTFPKDAETQDLDVRFQLNRVTLRRQHQALCAEHHAGHLVFPPTNVDAVSESTLSELSVTLNDPKIASNPRQFRAIKEILSLPSTSPPYIIFGP